MSDDKPPIPRLLERFEAELTRCAIERWRDPVAFGWRARRCTEAMLLLLVARHAPAQVTSARGAGIDRLLAMDLFKKGAKGFTPSRDFALAVQGIQSHGNTFAHVQTESLDDRANAEHVALDLVKLVPMLYDRPLDALPPQVSRAMRAIQSQDAALEPPAERALREARDQLQRELAGRVTPPPPPSPRGRWVVPAASFALGALASFALRSLASPAGAPPPLALPPPPLARLAPPAAPVARDAPEAQPPPACPGDAVMVPAMRFNLSAPARSDRPQWPAPHGGADQRISVPSFCLRRSVLSLAKARELDPARVDAMRGCRPSTRADEALGCATHEDARALCAAWHPRGRLPTSLEWEALAHAVEEQRAQAVDPWEKTAENERRLEWVDEAFPAPWMARGPARRGDFVTRGPILPRDRRLGSEYARNSWNHHRSERVPTIYVRCAVTP
ncbi:MAG: hypothetical protein R3A48_13685 [Polyangiales bacterium]